MAPSEVISDTVAHTLAHNNLLRVFSNRDPSSRLAAIKETYHPDIIMNEPDCIITGHDGVNAKVEELLGERKGWGFVPAGNVTKNHEMVFLAWGFGPVGKDGTVDVKAKGADVFTVEEGLIKKFWVIIEGVTDVKV